MFERFKRKQAAPYDIRGCIAELHNIVGKTVESMKENAAAFTDWTPMLKGAQLVITEMFATENTGLSDSQLGALAGR